MLIVSILFSRCLNIKSYDLENSIGLLLYRTAMAYRKALDLELRRKTGVTFGQWKVLTLLSKQEGLSQKEIADRLEIEGPSLIPIIDKMEMKGLLARKVDPEDRRNNRIYLTPIAESKWNSLVECSMHVREASIRGIPDDEVKNMRKALEMVSKNLISEYEVEQHCTVKSIASISADPNSIPKNIAFNGGTA